MSETNRKLKKPDMTKEDINITTKNVKHAKVQKRVYKLSTNVEFLEVAYTKYIGRDVGKRCMYNNRTWSQAGI